MPDKEKPTPKPTYGLLAFSIGQAFRHTVATQINGEDALLEALDALGLEFRDGLQHNPEEIAEFDVDSLDRDSRNALAFVGTKPGATSKLISNAVGCNVGVVRGIINKLLNAQLVRREKPSRGPIRHYCTELGYLHRERIVAEA